MARSFNGTSDFGSATVNLSSFNQLSIAFWLSQTSFNNSDGLVVEYSTNAGSNAGTFFIDPNSGSFAGNVEVLYSRPAATFDDITIARPSAAVWHHWAVLIDASVASTQITHVYIDGVDQSQNVRNNTASSGNFGNFTMYFMSRAGSSLFNVGLLADMALWGGHLLSTTEVSQLVNGVRPVNVNSANLQGWWPLDGFASPEPDLSSNANNMSLTGTSRVLGPPPLWRISA